ncbi:MAG: hypothetical protein ACFFC6_05765 [Promethearchaeota archaeon]
MNSNRTKFPFKYFLPIIHALEKENTLSAWQIAKSIGSCISDASEVTRMLHYITHYGKIISEQGKWKIIRKEENTDPPSKDFRVKYIQNYITLIETLNNELQSVEEIAKKTSLEMNEIEENLPYLSLITNKGSIELHGSGPRKQWGLKP